MSSAATLEYTRSNIQKDQRTEIKSSLYQNVSRINCDTDNMLLKTFRPSPNSNNKIKKKKEKRKGKHASSTENRRIVWKYIIWPLILQNNRQSFSLQEYRDKTDEFRNRISYIQPHSSSFAGGLISLVDKGVLAKNKGIYSIDYRLVPYMHKKIKLEYGVAVKKTYA